MNRQRPTSVIGSHETGGSSWPRRHNQESSRANTPCQSSLRAPHLLQGPDYDIRRLIFDGQRLTPRLPKGIAPAVLQRIAVGMFRKKILVGSAGRSEYKTITSKGVVRVASSTYPGKCLSETTTRILKVTPPARRRQQPRMSRQNGGCITDIHRRQTLPACRLLYRKFGLVSGAS